LCVDSIVHVLLSLKPLCAQLASAAVEGIVRRRAGVPVVHNVFVAEAESNAQNKERKQKGNHQKQLCVDCLIACLSGTHSSRVGEYLSRSTVPPKNTTPTTLMLPHGHRRLGDSIQVGEYLSPSTVPRKSTTPTTLMLPHELRR
jgi:predicted exporter